MDNLQLNKAIMAIARRAEARIDKLSETFVDIEILELLLETPDHQILFGRRGTGKTHVLNFLSEAVKRRGELSIFVDMRTIASTGGIIADKAIPFSQRAAILLKDTIEVIETGLDEYVLRAAYESDEDFSLCMAALDRLAEELTAIRIEGGLVESTTTDSAQVQRESQSGFALSVDPPGLGFRHSRSKRGQVTTQDSLKITGASQEHHVHFGSVQTALNAVIETLPVDRVWVLLDEWTDVPRDLQPVLAEFLRRCLLPVQRITVKIAAIEKRANFCIRGRQVGEYLGFELGADISADADLDDFFSAQHDEDLDRAFLAELIWKHVKAVAPKLVGELDSGQLMDEVFSEEAAFYAIVEAAAGVPRDALNVLRIAAQRADRQPISFRMVREAVRAWYKRDKLAAVKSHPTTQEIFDEIMDKIIGQKGQICFLVKDQDTDSSSLNELFDARLIHTVKKDIPSRADVALRYTLFRFDSGAYIDLPPSQISKADTKYIRHYEYTVITVKGE